VACYNTNPIIGQVVAVIKQETFCVYRLCRYLMGLVLLELTMGLQACLGRRLWTAQCGMHVVAIPPWHGKCGLSVHFRGADTMCGGKNRSRRRVFGVILRFACFGRHRRKRGP
jgi:hypothetical protein